MIKSVKILILALFFLFLPITVFSQKDLPEFEWNGDKYFAESFPLPENINDILDDYREQVIAKGISAEYFDEHFDLVSIAHGEPSFVFEAGEYRPAFLYGLRSSSLHEIIDVLPREEAESILKNCVGDFEIAIAKLQNNGDLILSAYSKEGNLSGVVNVETGECKVSEVVATISGAGEDVAFTDNVVPAVVPARGKTQGVWLGLAALVLLFVVFFLFKKFKR